MTNKSTPSFSHFARLVLIYARYASLLIYARLVLRCFVSNLSLYSDRPCPPDKPRVNCLVAPCMFATCPAYPQAICVDNYCGGCFADFYYQYRKVDCSKYNNIQNALRIYLSLLPRAIIMNIRLEYDII